MPAARLKMDLQNTFTVGLGLLQPLPNARTGKFCWQQFQPGLLAQMR